MVALLLWTLVPLAAIHVALLWRDRRAWRFQLLLDAALLLLVGPALVRGLDLNPVRVLAAHAPFTGWSWRPQTTLEPTQSDVVLQLHPWWAEAREQLREGRLPLVAPHVGGGVPLLAHGQVGLFAPVMLPVWVLGPERGTTVMAVWKLELAALGAFLFLLWQHRLRPAAAAVAGLGWGLAPFTVAWLLSPLAWSLVALPWAWWLIERAGSRRARWWFPLLAGGLLGWLMGAGFNPESAAIVAGSALLWGLFAHPRRWPRMVSAGLAATTVALLLAWPTLAAIGASAKVHAYRAQPPNRASLPGEVRRAALAQLLVPAVHGHPGRGTYRAPFPWAAAAAGVGGGLLALFVAGPIRRRRQRLAAAATAMLGVAAVLAYRVPPLDWLLVRIPPLDRMTLPRFVLLAPWGLVLLAGLGLDGVVRGASFRRLAWLVPAGMAVLVVVVSHPGWHVADWGLALMTAVAAAAVLLVLRRRPGLAPFVVGAELVILAVGVNPTAAPADRLPTPPVLERLVARARSEPGRVVALDGVLPANMASRYGLSDLRAFDPVRPWPLARLHALLGAADPVLPGPLDRAPPRLCGAFAVRFLLTPEGSDAPGWRRVDGGDGVWVWENPLWQPEVRVVGRTVAPPEKEGWALLAEDDEVLADGAVLPPGGPMAAATRLSLQVVARTPARLDVEVTCDGPCLVTLAQPWAPGWRALVDRRPAPLVRANLAGLGVIAPAGRHRAQLEYRPWW